MVGYRAGDTDDFYIADAFGTLKEAYGRRVGGARTRRRRQV